MKAIILIDTSVYLNILDVPGRNQERVEILSEFEEKIKANDIFLLPLMTIIETGNHIVRRLDGNQRRRYAGKMRDDVIKALKDETPYRAPQFPQKDDLIRWLADFPNHVNQFRGNAEDEDGAGFSDFTIFKEWEQTCERYPMSRVLIWSLDDHLKSYDREP
ncbi:MAG: hypothetical protein LBW77_04490 [Verrucomicrobiota bacterium]|jgi:hypothetical protein|nr:hypothetical protein [Verrucomicrobiota bacterium]